MQEEFPDYTPLLAKILEGLLSGGSDEDKVRLNHEVCISCTEMVLMWEKSGIMASFLQQRH